MVQEPTRNITFHREYALILVVSQILAVGALAFGRTKFRLSGRRVAIRASSMSMKTATTSAAAPLTPMVQIRIWFALYLWDVITNIAELDAHEHIKVTTYAIDEILGTEAR